MNLSSSSLVRQGTISSSSESPVPPFSVVGATLSAIPYIFRLPNEVQLRIIHLFIAYALAPFHDLTLIEIEHRQDLLLASRAATAVTHVCQHWRAICRADPSAWCCIIVPIIDANDLRNMRWFAAMVMRHRELSQNLKVTAKIVFCCTSPLFEYESLGPPWFSIMLDMAGLSSRWHSFQTTTGNDDQLGQCIWNRVPFEKVPSFQPTAEHLSIDSALFKRWLQTRRTPLDRCRSLTADVDESITEEWPASQRVHESMQSLDLRIRGHARRGAPGDWHLAKSVLTLPRFPSLHSLTIRIPIICAEEDQIWATDPAQAPLPVPRFRLELLQHFSCYGFESYGQLSIAPYLIPFEAPSLISFLCKEPYLTTLPDFLQRSNCALTTLHICVADGLALDDSLLQHLPNLTTLGLSAIPGAGTYTAVRQLRDPAVLPYLEDLTLEVLNRARAMSTGDATAMGFTRGSRLLQIVEARQQRLKRLCASVTEQDSNAEAVRKHLESYRATLKCKVLLHCTSGIQKTVDVGWEEQEGWDGWDFPENANSVCY